jgi:hypothetical protein
VKLAPALLPSGLDRGRGDRSEDELQSLLAVGVRVDREFAVRLLEALGMELEQPRPRLLEDIRRNRDRDPPQLAQRNALFNFSKNPSSRL